jgi:glycosyltransferase involved in cell wall biosynthesis
VALFSDTFEPQINGVANTLRHLLETYEEQGMDYLVFAPGERTAREGRICRVSGWKLPLYPEHQVSRPPSAWVARLLGEFRPDLVHVATEFSLGRCGRAYALRTGVPLVSSFHTDFPLYLRKYGLAWLEPAAWRYLRRFHGAARRTFCPSRATLAKLRAWGFTNLCVWGRGVTPVTAAAPGEVARTRRKYRLLRKTTLLYVGRLSREKDLDVLFAAFARLNRQGLEDQVRLLVVGDGPLRGVLEAQAPPNATFTGYLRGAELAAVYAAADVFAFPSTSETYGNVILEAMSAGLPVVAPASGGITENLQSGRNGLACCPRDVGEFAAGLARLCRDPEYRWRLGQNARATAEERSWAAANRALLDEYRAVSGASLPVSA